jgi:acyl-CoA reductase-like NAD-dependent aldehyde dehydrogenase
LSARRIHAVSHHPGDETTQIGPLVSQRQRGRVDEVVAVTDTRELRRRLLPARLVVYF